MKVVNYELAKQLQKAGFPQDNMFYYHQISSSSWGIFQRHELVNPTLSAPSADEIIDLLPDFVKTKDRLDYWLYIGREDKNTWNLFYEHNNKVVEMVLEKEEKSYLKFVGDGKGNSLADAAANCWLSLKKNELI